MVSHKIKNDSDRGEVLGKSDRCDRRHARAQGEDQGAWRAVEQGPGGMDFPQQQAG